MRLGAWRRNDVIVPPFACVSLVECRERVELTPLYWYREFVAYGKFDATAVGPALKSPLRPSFDALMASKSVWVVTAWRRFEDGREEDLRTHCLGAGSTEADAKKTLSDELRFLSGSREDSEGLLGCFAATDEDRAYVETRFPSVIRPPESGSIDEQDRYQSLLRVMAGLQPKTVELIYKADTAPDTRSREAFEKRAVEIFFAELAHFWTDDLVKRWLQSNPMGIEGVRLFGRVLDRPKLKLDAIDYELALNWLKRKYNLLTAAELSHAVYKATGKRIKPTALKKRRERMGLTTKRPPGPRPRSEG